MDTPPARPPRGRRAVALVALTVIVAASVLFGRAALPALDRWLWVETRRQDLAPTLGQATTVRYHEHRLTGAQQGRLFLGALEIYRWPDQDLVGYRVVDAAGRTAELTLSDGTSAVIDFSRVVVPTPERP